eukprot:94918-Chlamydomonas_euryale.AAC.1
MVLSECASAPERSMRPCARPSPRQEMLSDHLAGAKLFTALDLQSGYHQIRIKQEDVPKTGFVTPFGHDQFKVLTFGFANAPATFQAIMDKLFQPLLYKGMLVYPRRHPHFSQQEHDQLLEQVLDILQKTQLYARLFKCEFKKRDLKYLGHIISEEGIKVDPAKTHAVDEWPRPKM